MSKYSIQFTSSDYFNKYLPLTLPVGSKIADNAR